MLKAYREWAELHDRQEDVGPLSDEQRARLAELAQNNPACHAELAFFEELARLSTPPVAQNRERIIEASIEAVNERAKVVPLWHSAELREPGTISLRSRIKSDRGLRYRLLWAALAMSSAVAAFLLIGSDKLPSLVTGAAVGPAPIELTYSSGDVMVDGVSAHNRSPQPESSGPDSSRPHVTKIQKTLTTAEGRACIALDPSIDVCVGPHTELHVRSISGPERVLELLQGQVVAALEKQPMFHKFSIVSGNLRATAVGTAFAVEKPDARQSVVTVLEGNVEVTTDDDKTTVRVDEQLRLNDKRVVTRRTARSEQSPYWALLEPRSLWKRQTVGTLHLQTQPARAEVTLGEQSLGRTPLTLVMPSGKHVLSLKLDGHVPQETTALVKMGRETVLSVALAPESTGPPAVSESQSPVSHRPKPATPTASALLKQARLLMSQNRWREAAYTYERLRQAYPGSPEAHTVLLALGQLQLDQLGQPGLALRSFDAYLKGGGPLAQEARSGRIRALRRLGRHSAETGAIQDYLRLYPRSEEADKLRARLLELSR